MKPEFQDVVLKKYGYRDWDSIYAAVGHGGLKEGAIVGKLNDEYEKTRKKEVTDEQVLDAISDMTQAKRRVMATKGSIIVQGMDDVAVHFSKCCSPVPGDEICGFVTRGRGVTVHRTDCTNIIHLSEEERRRIVPAEWNAYAAERGSELFSAEINIYANNRPGVLLGISKILTENNIDITSMNVRTSKQGTATITIGFDIRDTETLRMIVGKLRNLENVIDIQRAMG